MPSDEFAIEAQPHLVAFGDEDEVVPSIVGFPQDGDLFVFNSASRSAGVAMKCGLLLGPLEAQPAAGC
jgi:hypothetical protein